MKPSNTFFLNFLKSRSGHVLAACFFLCLVFTSSVRGTEKMQIRVDQADQKAPHFPGGEIVWNKYLDRNLGKTVPLKNGAPAGTYTVVVSFIVDKSGSLSEVNAENDPGYGTKEEALKLIKKGPKWVPAEKDGQKVIYRHKQNIEFVVK